MPDLAAQPAQAIAGVALGGIQLGGNRLELDADGRQTLQQGVVNLAAQPGALVEDERTGCAPIAAAATKLPRAG